VLDSIENSIVKGLIYDETYARKVFPFLKEEFFDGATKEIFKLYSELFEKYNKIPSMETMLVSMQNRSLSEDIFEGGVGLLQSAYSSRKELPDSDWLSDETERYCVDKAMYNAIYKSISIIEGVDKQLDKHAIPEILDEALSISFNQSVGSDYLEDFARRFEYYTNEDSRLKFPLDALNELSNGGLPPKTLNAILASTNTGKSAMMCYLAGEWLKMGKNVLYISMEMSEETVQERIDANLLDIKTDDLKRPDLDREWFANKIKNLQKQTVGKLIVKEYPTGSGHAGHFRHLLKELKQKKKFKPDIIFIDYINICASSRYKSMNGVNSYSYIKAIAEELRGLAVEFDVPVFTATQVNRDGANSQSPDMTATSDSFGLPMSLDWFAAIVTNDELMEMGRQMLLLLKTRYGNKQGKKNKIIGINFDKMRYYDVESTDDAPKSINKSDTSSLNKPTENILTGNRTKGIPDDIEWD
jgi:replicative DNA helicase